MQYSPTDAVEERRVVAAAPPRFIAANAVSGVRVDALVILIAVSFVLRLTLAACVPLTADEAYAVVVSRSHSLSYYDHPPMMFALARLMADISGHESPFVMRLPFVAMGTASIWLLYDLTRRAFGRGAALWAASAFSLSPFFLTFGQVLIVPDGPLDFGLLLCFWFIQPRLAGTDPAAWRWPAAGLALGFALLSKYQAVLFAVAALSALALDPRWRNEFRCPAFWAAQALAIACLCPVLVWNAQHDWISFAFQMGRSYQAAGMATHLTGLLSVLAGQILYLLPFTWAGAHGGIFRALSGRSGSQAWLMANLAIWPILIFDIVALFGHHALAHWAMSGFLFALPLVGKARAQKPSGAAGARLVLAASAIPLVVLLLSLQALSGDLSIFGRPLPDLGRFNVDWTGLESAIPDDGLPVVASDWVTAGRAGIALGTRHPVTVASDPHHFKYMTDLKIGARAYFVTSSPGRWDVSAQSSGIPNAYGVLGQPLQVVQRHGAATTFRITIARVVRNE